MQMYMYTYKYISNKYVPQVILFEHDVMPSQASRNLRLKRTVGVQKRRVWKHGYRREFL